MAGNICSNCGAELLQGARFCSKCRCAVAAEGNASSAGAVISTDVQHCSSCGAELLPGAKFCSKCRAPAVIGANTYQQTPVSPFAVFNDVSKPEKASKWAVLRTVIAGAACLSLLVLCIIFIPDRIRDSRSVEEKDEFIVAEDTTSEEQAAEYDRINAAIEAGEYENYEPETFEDGPEYYEKEFGPYQWMNYPE